MGSIISSKLVIGEKYSRKDIYRIFNVPKEYQDGNWNTGYNEYENQFFVFVNISSAGRTGHDYNNKLSNNIMEWYSKNTHDFNSPTIQKLIKANYKNRFFFIRTNSNRPAFTYQGYAKVC